MQRSSVTNEETQWLGRARVMRTAPPNTEVLKRHSTTHFPDEPARRNQRLFRGFEVLVGNNVITHQLCNSTYPFTL